MIVWKSTGKDTVAGSCFWNWKSVSQGLGGPLGRFQINSGSCFENWVVSNIQRSPGEDRSPELEGAGGVLQNGRWGRAKAVSWLMQMVTDYSILSSCTQHGHTRVLPSLYCLAVFYLLTKWQQQLRAFLAPLGISTSVYVNATTYLYLEPLFIELSFITWLEGSPGWPWTPDPPAANPTLTAVCLSIFNFFVDVLPLVSSWL